MDETTRKWIEQVKAAGQTGERAPSFCQRDLDDDPFPPLRPSCAGAPTKER